MAIGTLFLFSRRRRDEGEEEEEEEEDDVSDAESLGQAPANGISFHEEAIRRLASISTGVTALNAANQNLTNDLIEAILSVREVKEGMGVDVCIDRVLSVARVRMAEFVFWMVWRAAWLLHRMFVLSLREAAAGFGAMSAASLLTAGLGRSRLFLKGPGTSAARTLIINLNDYSLDLAVAPS
ncbi:Protein of unknown function [Gryllus bimaculatus]|nr:Protein of unknown function [Gryllus bimaculatus]